MMKNILVILIVLMSSVFTANAQLTAYINGKPVKNGETIKKEDLPSLEISFKNPKKPSFLYGRLSYVVELVNNRGVAEGVWYIRKDGIAAIEDFLDNTPATKKFKVYDKNVMTVSGNDLDWIIKAAAGQMNSANMKLQISLLFREETGYKEYGQPVHLCEQLIFDVPVWNAKSLHLPYLELSIDHSQIGVDVNLKQNGKLGNPTTILGYWMRDKQEVLYTAYAISNEQFSDMNVKELANDFMYTAAYNASQDFVTKFDNYDMDKYHIDWKAINDIESEKKRIPNLSWKVNRDIKKMELFTFFAPVEINGLKGYKYQADLEFRSNRSDKWKNNGKFIMYIFEHPTNPKLTLVISNNVFNSATSYDELDKFLLQFINSIKK